MRDNLPFDASTCTKEDLEQLLARFNEDADAIPTQHVDFVAVIGAGLVFLAGVFAAVCWLYVGVKVGLFWWQGGF